MIRLLIDGDVLAHKAAAAGKTEVQWDVDVYSLALDVAMAAGKAAELLARWADELRADELVVAFSDPRRRYFRHDLWPGYKGGRTSLMPGWSTLLERVAGEHRVVCWPNLEADDVLGILATEPDAAVGALRIVVSIDKDMMTVPGFHWNPDKPAPTALVERAEADRQHLLQTLTGDQVDGYPGCPGIGKVKAEAALEAEPTWEKVIELYEKRGLTEADALLQARLARILRHGEYDPQTGQVSLWTPNTSGSHA